MPSPGRVIDAAELTRHAAHLGRDYCAGDTCDAALLEGVFGVDTLPGGLVLRRASVRNRHDMRCRLQVSPGFKLVLVLAGDVDVRFGNRRLPGADRGRFGHVIHLNKPAAFERRARRDDFERSLTLTLPPEWLAQRLVTLGDGRRGARLKPSRHLQMTRWPASAALRAQAESLFTGPVAEGPSHRLRCESLALAMIADALPALLDTHAIETPPQPIDARRTRRLRDLVDRSSNTSLSVAALAREAGMSRSSLQRHFTACYGTSVQRFLRERRLQAARRALCEQRVSVMEAAEIAGYASAANFATAYRRAFGLTPRASRTGTRKGSLFQPRHEPEQRRGSERQAAGVRA